MNELFGGWSWKQKQPAPFDQFNDSQLRRSDAISMSNAGPRKEATVHPVTIRAILAYMNLELGTKPLGQNRLGAIGSQGNDFTIAEYPSLSGEMHVIAYNRNRGTFKAGRYADPITPTEKPAGYVYSENGNSGTALFFALMPMAMADALRSGNLGVMDYYKFQNVQADTKMKTNFADTDLTGVLHKEPPKDQK